MLADVVTGAAVVYVFGLPTTAALVAQALRSPKGRAFLTHFGWKGTVTAVACVLAWPITLPYILFPDRPKRPT